VTLLPPPEQLREVFDRIERVLQRRADRHARALHPAGERDAALA